MLLLSLSVTSGECALRLSRRQASRCGDPLDTSTPIGRCTTAGQVGDVITVCNGCVSVFRSFYSCAGVDGDSLLDQLQRACDDLHSATAATPTTSTTTTTTPRSGTSTAPTTTATPRSGTSSPESNICSDTANSNSDLDVCLAEFAARTNIACQSSCQSVLQTYASQCLGQQEAQSLIDDIRSECEDSSGTTKQAAIFSTTSFLLLAVVASFL